MRAVWRVAEVVFNQYAFTDTNMLLLIPICCYQYCYRYAFTDTNVLLLIKCAFTDTNVLLLIPVCCYRYRYAFTDNNMLLLTPTCFYWYQYAFIDINVVIWIRIRYRTQCQQYLSCYWPDLDFYETLNVSKNGAIYA